MPTSRLQLYGVLLGRRYRPVVLIPLMQLLTSRARRAAARTWCRTACETLPSTPRRRPKPRDADRRRSADRPLRRRGHLCSPGLSPSGRRRTRCPSRARRRGRRDSARACWSSRVASWPPVSPCRGCGRRSERRSGAEHCAQGRKATGLHVDDAHVPSASVPQRDPDPVARSGAEKRPADRRAERDAFAARRPRRTVRPARTPILARRDPRRGRWTPRRLRRQSWRRRRAPMPTRSSS